METGHYFSISWLHHLLFCGRQSALIHAEGIPEDNPLTIEGQSLHDSVDAARADAPVRIRPQVSFPVEYKPRTRDEIELCAQALRLEELTGVAVKRGPIDYGTFRRRIEVNPVELLR